MKKSNKPATLSVAIATFNEAQNIKRCLSSIQNLASEIILVDGQSTDNTVEIAKKYQNLTLISTKNQPMFHLNKQLAIDNCHSDWILQLDADEEVSPDLFQELTQILQKPASDFSDNGFWINRQNYFLGRFLTKGGVYPDPTIRLYKRGYGQLPCQDVHEQAAINGSVGHLQHDLFHYSDPTFSRYLIRQDRYTSLLATQISPPLNFFGFLNYFFLKPIYWFILSFFLHKGFVDSFPGFVFSFFSSLRFPIAYIKYWEKNHAN